MAAVQVVSSVTATWSGNSTTRCGPFQDVNGNLWVILLGASSGAAVPLIAFKSSDSGASWGTSFSSASSFVPISGGSGGSFDCVYDGNDVIYTVTQNSVSIRALNIMSFTISTQVWAEVFSSGTKPVVNTDVNTRFPLSLARRSTGEFVVFYQGPLHTLMGSPFRACYYALCSAAGVWSAGVEVSGAVKLHHYDAKSAVLGDSDLVHMFFADGSVATHCSLSSADVLDTANTISTGFNQTNYYNSYYNATLAKVVVTSGSSGGTSFIWRATSAANPTWASDTNVYGDSRSTIASQSVVYDATGVNLYCFYCDTPSENLFVNSSAGGGTTWGTAALQETGSVALGVSTGLVTGGIGIVFDDNGTVFFDTFSLGGGVIVGILGQFSTHLSGRGAGW